MSPNSLILYDHADSPGSSLWDANWIEETIESGVKRSASRKLAPNLTRRTHKKSRHGCLTCKTRKIKCGEEKPSCKHCVLKSNPCIYPSATIKKENSYPKRSTSISSSVSSTSDTFSLQDMQFFHHFLTIAYPHLPLGNDAVWIREIPQFAQDHSYLMHAMLALGASHLGRVIGNSKHENVALTHRGYAIAGLNRALAKADHAYGEADAMLAACYALTFQSSYMSDGMADFLTFVRGCALATGKIREEGARTAFDLRPNRHFEIVIPRLQRMPQVSLILVLEGLEALDGIQQYLTSNAEFGFHAAMRQVLVAMQKDSPSGYIAFVKIYAVWYNLSHEDFTMLLNTSNVTSQILLGFFVGLQLAMTPLASYEWPERSAMVPEQTLKGIFGWFKEISKRVPNTLQYHLEWPRRIVDTCVAEVEGMPFDGPSVLMMDTKYKLLEERGR